VALSVTTVSKTVATVTASWAWVLKIKIRAERLAAALSLVAKGKQVRIDVRPTPASIAPQKVYCDRKLR
jgi:hypothetical protein